MKSSPQITTGRPSIFAVPITALVGEKSIRLPSASVSDDARDAALLAEAALVDERVDALAHGEAAARVLLGDRLGAAELARPRRGACAALRLRFSQLMAARILVRPTTLGRA